MRLITRLILCFCTLFLLIPDTASASHFRGGDIWATIDANGVVTLNVRSRWRKDAAHTQPFPFSGWGVLDGGIVEIYRINPNGSATLVNTPGAGSFVDKDTGGSLSDPLTFLTDTTVATDFSDANFDERLQRVILPLGSFNPGFINAGGSGRNINALNLPQAPYEIRWRSCARIAGIINNLNTSGGCQVGVSYYGLRARVAWNGTANGSPAFNASVITGVVRNADYAQNLNAIDPDGQSLAYQLAATNRDVPDFGPQSHISGLTLDQFGNVKIPAASTNPLLNNSTNPGADYMEKFVITDPSGALSERDILLDAVSDRGLPQLSPIGNRTVQVGGTLTFPVSATCPGTGLACTALAIRTSNLPTGATLSAPGGNPLTRTFSWTPALEQVGTYNINFEAVASFSSSPQTARSEFVTITVVGTNLPPRLQEIGNLRVGADPLNVTAFVTEPSTFDVFAIDPNAGDVLTYSLPVLIAPNGSSVPLSNINAALTQEMVFGHQVGRITIAPDAADVGVWQLRVRVDDGNGASDEQNVFVSVGTFANRSPIFNQPPPQEIFATEGLLTQFNVMASDPDSGQIVTLSAQGLPPGASFVNATGNPVTRAFSWTPGAGTAGDYTVVFEARDNAAAQITERLSAVIHVSPPCLPNTVSRILRLEPGMGSENGGTTVVVVGGPWCSPITQVTFDGQPGTNITPTDINRFSVVAPAGSVGQSADVVVTTANGQTLTLTDGFAYLDATAPVLSCGAGLTLAAGLNGTAVLPDLLGSISVSDNLTPTAELLLYQSPLAGTVLGPGEHTVTITAIDEQGNVSSCTQIVTVADQSNPEVFCPAPVVLAADGSGAARIPDFLTGLAASDNVTSTANLVMTQTPAAGTVVGIGTHTVTIEVTDEAGNTATCGTTVTVQDQTPPALSACPATVTVSAGLNGLGVVPDLFAGLTASDNITPDAMLVKTQSPEAGALLGVGSHQISLTVADEAGNTASCGVTLEVVDTTDPVLMCPMPQSAQPDANGQATVPDFLAGLDATDNVTPAGSLMISQSPPAGTVLGIGTHTIVITVTDAAGNDAGCSTTFTIHDTVAPTIAACAAPTSAPADASGLARVPDVLAAVLASDNVTPTGDLQIMQSPAAGTPLGVGVHSITVTVTDGAGNSSTCTTTFEVFDATPPDVTPPGAATIPAGADGLAAVPDFLAGLSASDNVTDGNALLKTQDPAAGTPLGVGTHPVSITVTDEAGNATAVATSVTIVDATPPMVVCPLPAAGSTDASGVAILPDLLAGVTASDNVSTNLSMSQSPAAGTPLGPGTHTVTVTVTDEAGNSASCTTTFEVLDETPPAVTAPAAATVPAGSDGQAAVPDFLAGLSASDNVTDAGALLKTQDPVAGTLLGVGNHPVSITVTDEAGNATTVATSVTIVDNTPPMAVCPLPVTLSANANGVAAIPDLLAGVTASDNVTASGNLTTSQSPAAGTLLGPGTHTVTVTVTDEAGNSTSCTTTVTIEDDTAPVISGPANMTVDATSAAGATVSFGATATDNVDGAVTVSCAPPSGSLFPTGTTPALCTAEDAAGNEATHTFSVTVVGSAGQIEDIIEEILAGAGTSAGSLESKLDAALAALDRGNTTAACGSLNATRNQLEAQSGKSIPAAVAAALIADIDRVRAVVGCN